MAGRIQARGYHPKIFLMKMYQEMHENMRDVQERTMSKKKLRHAYWRGRVCLAMEALQGADPTGWNAWFDKNENVPDDASDREIAQLAKARVIVLTGSFPKADCRLYKDIFIWTDEAGTFIFSKEIGKPKLYMLEFTNRDEAMRFVDGLPDKALGYGWALDILPAGAENVFAQTVKGN